MPEMPDVMFLTDSGIAQLINGVSSEIRIASSLPFNNGGIEYHHSRIVEELRKENESLHLEIDDCHKRLNRWADAHSEMIGEVELRKENEELQAKLDKAKDGLYFYMDIGLYEGVSLGVAPINDDRGQRARTTLGELE